MAQQAHALIRRSLCPIGPENWRSPLLQASESPDRFFAAPVKCCCCFAFGSTRTRDDLPQRAQTPDELVGCCAPIGSLKLDLHFKKSIIISNYRTKLKPLFEPPSQRTSFQQASPSSGVNRAGRMQPAEHWRWMRSANATRNHPRKIFKLKIFLKSKKKVYGCFHLCLSSAGLLSSTTSAASGCRGVDCRNCKSSSASSSWGRRFGPSGASLRYNCYVRILTMFRLQRGQRCGWRHPPHNALPTGTECQQSMLILWKSCTNISIDHQNAKTQNK